MTPTKEQTKNIREMVEFSMKRLRCNQDIVRQQLGMAHEKRDDEALTQLHTWAKEIDCAISLKNFDQPMWFEVTK